MSSDPTSPFPRQVPSLSGYRLGRRSYKTFEMEKSVHTIALVEVYVIIERTPGLKWAFSRKVSEWLYACGAPFWRGFMIIPVTTPNNTGKIICGSGTDEGDELGKLLQPAAVELVSPHT